jgi:hypothetical protein
VSQLPTPGLDVTVSQMLKQNGAQVKTVIWAPPTSLRAT